MATSFAVITGHEDPAKAETQVHWRALATAADTLVILMGVGRLADIVAGLTAGGRDPRTPVAIVRWGTHPRQSTLVSTLADVVRDAEAASVGPPSAIIVGQVVALRPELAWFDNRPLSGRRGLVTRVRQQASDLSGLLRRHGAVPLEMPLIRLVEPDSWEPADRALAACESFDWLIFTSANGVAAVVEHLAARGEDIRALKGPRIAAIGERTAAAAAAAGLRVSLCPDEFVAESLLEALATAGLAGKRLLLLRAAEAREVLPEQARAAGAEVLDVAVYRTLPVEQLDPAVLRQLEDGEVDFVTFASSSSVKSLVAALGEARARELLAAVCVGCIGPVTAAAAEEAGLHVAVVPEEHTIEGLVGALGEHFATVPRRFNP